MRPRYVGDARDAVVHEVGVLELRTVVDELLEECASHASHALGRGTEIPALDRPRIQGETDVGDGDELVDGDDPGVRVDLAPTPTMPVSQTAACRQPRRPA